MFGHCARFGGRPGGGQSGRDSSIRPLVIILADVHWVSRDDFGAEEHDELPKTAAAARVIRTAVGRKDCELKPSWTGCIGVSARSDAILGPVVRSRAESRRVG
jgi:hypothetical protein